MYTEVDGLVGCSCGGQEIRTTRFPPGPVSVRVSAAECPSPCVLVSESNRTRVAAARIQFHASDRAVDFRPRRQQLALWPVQIPPSQVLFSFFLSICSSAPAASSPTMYSSHTVPALAFSHQPTNNIFLSHHSNHPRTEFMSPRDSAACCVAASSCTW